MVSGSHSPCPGRRQPRVSDLSSAGSGVASHIVFPCAYCCTESFFATRPMSQLYPTISCHLFEWGPQLQRVSFAGVKKRKGKKK
ncbi:hypothetical protein TIFTF001_020092 [Ficus carica]|uniref:Uncharacterized protein n=1 Tax=Ficus carica TaxID=3494 RepID=A0AA88AFG0_FICCA|nr:hypothetical protein TIFTF001_020092 [Ficus carica]